MSIVTMILGESGTGKSASLRNFSPQDTLLIQPIAKPLPFRSAGFKPFHKTANPQGNIFVTDDAASIIKLMQRTMRRVIVIDDFQYIMANEYMRRAKEHGFGKFTDIGRNAWDILNAAATLPDNKRVYLLSHTATDEIGRTKIKTIGKMLDEKITLEGMVTIVLRTQVQDGHYCFTTRNNGQDTTKTPMGLFEDGLIDNDLAAVDSAITDYYAGEELPQPEALPETDEENTFYPQDKFIQFLPQWQALIKQGKQTAHSLIAMIESKAPLNDDQKTIIHTL